MRRKNSKTIYLLGIGGIAMGTLATMLTEKGFNVTGSDLNLYPPMSTHLETLGIPVCQGYDAANPEKCAPDLVIIGNAIRRSNPEAEYVLSHGLPYLSMPQAIAEFFLCAHKSMVVAGTHGKSTTSSLLSWVLSRGGLDPSVFVGAFIKNWNSSYRIGRGPFMVIEGDEYDTAFFDKGPKFLHYSPWIGIVTSVEFDHADIFTDFEAVRRAFRSFARLIQPDGHLILNADDANCLALAKESRGRVTTYGWSRTADWRIVDMIHSDGRIRFTYENPLSRGTESMLTRMPGRHNVSNSMAVTAAASLAGLDRNAVQDGLLTFEGVKRRQDILGEIGGILVMDDFAHHPTAVRETIQALKDFYPRRRIFCAFEPRTNSSRRRVFQQAYATAFDDAFCICIKHPPGMDAIPREERLDVQKLVADIAERGKECHGFASTEELIGFLVDRCASGDLVVCMSNGSFDGLPHGLCTALAQKHAGAS